MENLNSNDALEVFVENYKKQLDKFCADVNIPRSQLMDFLLEKNDKILSQTKKLDIEMEKKKEYTGYEEINSDDRALFEAIVGKKEISYNKLDLNPEALSSVLETEEQCEDIEEELNNARKIVESKDEESINIEELSPKVKEIFMNQQQELDELSKMDPDTAVKKYISRKYPEIAEILKDKLDIPDLYQRMDNLPDNLTQVLREMLSDEYRGFVNDIADRGKKEQEKLNDKVNEYNQNFSKNIYSKYKELTPEEKEEFLKYSDDEITDNILKNLNRDVEIANENVEYAPIYSAYFDYKEKKEVSDEQEDKLVVDDISNTINEEVSLEEGRNSEIKKRFPYFGKGKDVSTSNNRIEKFNSLKEFLNPYLEAKDVKRAFNNMTDKNIATLREKSIESGIDVKELLRNTSSKMMSTYTDELDNCGNLVLEMANYSDDDKFTGFMQNAYDDQMREELVSIAKYKIDRDRDSEKELIRYSSQNLDYKYSDSEFKEIMNFCTFKYNVMEAHLKDVSSLSNVKVKEADNIGLRKFLNRADAISKQELEINASLVKSCDEKIKSESSRLEKLIPKKEIIINLKNKKKDVKETDGPVLGG